MKVLIINGFPITNKFLIFVNIMKVIFLDNDGVICLHAQWGGRKRKASKFSKLNPGVIVPVEHLFDDLDIKAVRILNKILIETGAEIVVSSDWKTKASLEELSHIYKLHGVIKSPIDFTPNFDSGVIYRTAKQLASDRCVEINMWLEAHPEVTKWVAIDDLDLSEKFGAISGNLHTGLKNFVHTTKQTEGIKQSGIKEKIIKFLKD